MDFPPPPAADHERPPSSLLICPISGADGTQSECQPSSSPSSPAQQPQQSTAQLAQSQSAAVVPPESSAQNQQHFPFLPVGTEVSAKFKGAFCEARVKKLTKSVKIKVTLRDSSVLTVDDSHVRNVSKFEANQPCEVVQGKQTHSGHIQGIKDCSTYTVVFNDGDERALKRSQLCPKSGRHFKEGDTLDKLPLYHPDKRHKKRRKEQQSPPSQSLHSSAILPSASCSSTPSPSQRSYRSVSVTPLKGIASTRSATRAIAQLQFEQEEADQLAAARGPSPSPHRAQPPAAVSSATSSPAASPKPVSLPADSHKIDLEDDELAVQKTTLEIGAPPAAASKSPTNVEEKGQKEEEEGIMAVDGMAIKRDRKEPATLAKKEDIKFPPGTAVLINLKSAGAGGRVQLGLVVSAEEFRRQAKCTLTGATPAGERPAIGTGDTQVPIRSFQNGRFNLTPLDRLSPFDPVESRKLTDFGSLGLKAAFERANQYVTKGELPPSWAIDSGSKRLTEKKQMVETSKAAKEAGKEEGGKKKMRRKEAGEKRERERKKTRTGDTGAAKGALLVVPFAVPDGGHSAPSAIRPAAGVSSARSSPSSPSSSSSEEDGPEDERQQQETKSNLVAHFYKFQEESGNELNLVPRLGDTDVDIYRFYELVNRMGGHKRVSLDGAWGRVLRKLHLDRDNTGAEGKGERATVTAGQVKDTYLCYFEKFEAFMKNLGNSSLTVSSLSSASQRNTRIIRTIAPHSTEHQKQQQSSSSASESRRGRQRANTASSAKAGSAESGRQLESRSGSLSSAKDPSPAISAGSAGTTVRLVCSEETVIGAARTVAVAPAVAGRRGSIGSGEKLAAKADEGKRQEKGEERKKTEEEEKIKMGEQKIKMGEQKIKMGEEKGTISTASTKAPSPAEEKGTQLQLQLVLTDAPMTNSEAKLVEKTAKPEMVKKRMGSREKSMGEEKAEKEVKRKSGKKTTKARKEKEGKEREKEGVDGGGREEDAMEENQPKKVSQPRGRKPKPKMEDEPRPRAKSSCSPASATSQSIAPADEAGIVSVAGEGSGGGGGSGYSVADMGQPAHIFTRFYQGQNVHARHHLRFYDARVVMVRQPSLADIAKSLRDAFELSRITHQSTPADLDKLTLENMSLELKDALRNLMNLTKVFVHYLGWNSRYDEWLMLHKVRVDEKDERASALQLDQLVPSQLAPQLVAAAMDWCASPEGIPSLASLPSAQSSEQRPRRLSVAKTPQTGTAAGPPAGGEQMQRKPSTPSTGSTDCNYRSPLNPFAPHSHHALSLPLSSAHSQHSSSSPSNSTGGDPHHPSHSPAQPFSKFTIPHLPPTAPSSVPVVPDHCPCPSPSSVPSAPQQHHLPVPVFPHAQSSPTAFFLAARPSGPSPSVASLSLPLHPPPAPATFLYSAPPVPPALPHLLIQHSPSQLHQQQAHHFTTAKVSSASAVSKGGGGTIAPYSVLITASPPSVPDSAQQQQQSSVDLFPSLLLPPPPVPPVLKQQEREREKEREGSRVQCPIEWERPAQMALAEVSLRIPGFVQLSCEFATTISKSLPVPPSLDLPDSTSSVAPKLVAPQIVEKTSPLSKEDGSGRDKNATGPPVTAPVTSPSTKKRKGGAAEGAMSPPSKVPKGVRSPARAARAHLAATSPCGGQGADSSDEEDSFESHHSESMHSLRHRLLHKMEAEHAFDNDEIHGLPDLEKMLARHEGDPESQVRLIEERMRELHSIHHKYKGKLADLERQHRRSMAARRIRVPQVSVEGAAVQ